MKKRWIATVLGAALAVSALSFTACGVNENPENNINAGASTKLKIQAFEGEHGKDWLRKLCEAYCAQNPDIGIKISWESRGTQILANVEGTADNRASDYDIVLTTQSPNKLGNRGYIADIKDVYDTKIPGEEKTVREKLGVLDRYYNVEGKYFAMPWANAKITILMNKTTLDKVYGKGKYQAPVTTDEWAAMCADLVAKANDTVHPLMWSVADTYWNYIYYTWWAQYQSVSEYFDFYEGYYRNADGTPDVAGTATRTFADNGQIYNQKGRLVALEELNRLIPRSKGYSHDATMSFTQAQVAFWGNGFDNDTKLGAFMPNGDWLSISMQKWNDRNPQDIVMIKTPVTSRLLDVLPDKSVTDDATLAKVIRAIDAGTAYASRGAALSGVTEADWNRIADARSVIMDTGTSHFIAIPAKSAYVKEAKDFLVFFASDAACSIYSSTLNGLTLPYNTSISLKNSKTSGIVTSEFELLKNSTYIYWDYHSRMSYLGGVNPASMSGNTPWAHLYYGTKTPEACYNDMKVTGATWNRMLQSTGYNSQGEIIG